MWPVAGHKKNIQFLENQLQNNNVFHAYLFWGPPSLGKFTIAKIFAQKLLCDNRKLDNCSSCQSLQKNIHPDFILIPNTDTLLSIEMIRELKRQLSFLPSLSKRRVVIFEEASYLTQEAQNALLKTIEEPPEYAVFILVAQKENLLPTILSRCFLLNFQPLSQQEIKAELLKRGFEERRASFLAHVSLGQIGRILKDELFLQKWERSLENLVNLSFSSSLKDKIEYVKTMDLEDLFFWLNILRDVLFFKINPSFLSDYPSDFLKKISTLSSSFEQKNIQDLINKINKTQELILTNVNKKLLLENLVLQL